MKSILQYIPGFRSESKLKMVVAAIYYLICLMTLASGLGMFLFSASIPFLAFNLFKGIKSKDKKALIVGLISVLLCFTGIGIIPKVQPSLANKNSTLTANKTVKSEKAKTSTSSNNQTPAAQTQAPTVVTTPSVNDTLKIHYIDVGQGDSELIQCNGQNMLIDTGTNASTSSLMAYLRNQNIRKIDILVLTHPHEDHIGGADDVIGGFEIGKVYMPKVTSTTKTFNDVVTAMKSKGLKATSPNPGDSFKLGDATCTILSPINVNSKDLNTYSIVIRVVFGSNKFLFTGDTQSSNEEELINRGFDLSADVLKVAHHSSKTSTSQKFLEKVTPKYAIIEVGKGNDYGHPHQVTLDRLEAMGVKVYRTDLNGTIICTSDGTNITFTTNQGTYAENNATTPNANPSPSPSPTPVTPIAPTTSSNDNMTVYMTNSGSCYHMDGCKSLSKSKIAITLKEAKANGLTPCKICNPPQ